MSILFSTSLLNMPSPASLPSHGTSSLHSFAVSSLALHSTHLAVTISSSESASRLPIHTLFVFLHQLLCMPMPSSTPIQVLPASQLPTLWHGDRHFCPLVDVVSRRRCCLSCSTRYVCCIAPNILRFTAVSVQLCFCNSKWLHDRNRMRHCSPSAPTFTEAMSSTIWTHVEFVRV